MNDYLVGLERESQRRNALFSPLSRGETRTAVELPGFRQFWEGVEGPV